MVPIGAVAPSAVPCCPVLEAKNTCGLGPADKEMHVYRTEKFSRHPVRRTRTDESESQRAAEESRCPPQNSGRTPEISDRCEANQGPDGAVQRFGRTSSHAGLRQEVPAEELGQPDIRWIVNSRLYGATRERFASRYRLERVLLGAGGHIRSG